MPRPSLLAMVVAWIVFLLLPPHVIAEPSLTIRIDKHLFESDCRYTFLSVELHVQIQDVTDHSDTSSFDIMCANRANRSQKFQNANIVRDFGLGSDSVAVELRTAWTAASDWDITASNSSWISISGISLPTKSYRFLADWIDFEGHTTNLSNETLVVYKDTGPSRSELNVQRKGISQIIKERYLGQQTFYVALILFMAGLLVAAVGW